MGVRAQPRTDARLDAVIAAVDATARKDVDIGHEAVAPRAPAHQDLGRALAASHEHQARRVLRAHRHAACYFDSAFIARSRPWMVVGYMRSFISSLMMWIDWR